MAGNMFADITKQIAAKTAGATISDTLQEQQQQDSTTQEQQQEQQQQYDMQAQCDYNILQAQQSTMTGISQSDVNGSQQFCQNESNMTARGAAINEAALNGENVYESDGQGGETEIENYGDDAV